MLAIRRGDLLGLGAHCGVGGGIHDCWRDWLLQRARVLRPAKRGQDARESAEHKCCDNTRHECAPVR